MELEFRKATRQAAPMLIALPGVSGSGKTYSALLLAAGLAGNGRVGMVDTENGRGSMYADSPGIVKALPNGYEIVRLDPPFPPSRYVAAIDAAEAAGINVLVIDSGSHEWEGIGGCCDIAEEKKLRGRPNWALAKREHKRFLNRCLFSSMHIIFCLRARDKIKIVKAGGKEEIIPIGIQPICEKNFVFEALLSLRLEEGTHHAVPIKVPEQFVSLFPEGRMITREHGEAIRQWSDGAGQIDALAQLQRRARSEAENGSQAYLYFFQALTKAQRQTLAGPEHERNKEIAAETDKAIAAEQPTEQV